MTTPLRNIKLKGFGQTKITVRTRNQAAFDRLTGFDDQQMVFEPIKIALLASKIFGYFPS
jgi:hypothetical protein